MAFAFRLHQAGFASKLHIITITGFGKVNDFAVLEEDQSNKFVTYNGTPANILPSQAITQPQNFSLMTPTGPYTPNPAFYELVTPPRLTADDTTGTVTYIQTLRAKNTDLTLDLKKELTGFQNTTDLEFNTILGALQVVAPAYQNTLPSLALNSAQSEGIFKVFNLVDANTNQPFDQSHYGLSGFTFNLSNFVANDATGQVEFVLEVSKNGRVQTKVQSLTTFLTTAAYHAQLDQANQANSAALTTFSQQVIFDQVFANLSTNATYKGTRPKNTILATQVNFNTDVQLYQLNTQPFNLPANYELVLERTDYDRVRSIVIYHVKLHDRVNNLTSAVKQITLADDFGADIITEWIPKINYAKLTLDHANEIVEHGGYTNYLPSAFVKLLTPAQQHKAIVRKMFYLLLKQKMAPNNYLKANICVILVFILTLIAEPISMTKQVL
ncbi:Lipoprotein associated domain [Mycoplasmopsis columbinasalis]|uniref:Lipoprotein associated domain n=1 Tax=Mycoplasmopsis columbinasalis TaxID=114880 RepID=A0A449B9D3_9BACT|nr:Lipoprotein associated domain [Mycoplasmopsis columbinasalis]